MLARAPTAPLLKRPTPAQVLLLRAAALPGPTALAAWAEWRRTAHVDDLEPDSQWLLPLLYCNLRRAGVAGAPLGRYANVYRHNWYKNHLLLRAGQPVLDALRGAGHPTLVLRGAATAAAYYPALGARPIEALVVCVPGLDGDAAARCLAGTGWQLDGPTARPEAVMFSDALGRRLSFEPVASGRHAPSSVLARVQAVRVQGTAFHVLGAPDQLVHILVQRAGWDPRSALLWATDAAQVVRGLDQPGWAAVWRCARDLDLEQPVAEGLRQLREDFGLTLPHAAPAAWGGA